MSLPKTPLNFLFIYTFAIIINPLRAQYVSARIDLVGLMLKDFRNINPSLEVSFSKKLSFCLGYENKKLAIGYLSTGSSGSGEESVEVYNVSGWAIRPELRVFLFPNKRPAPFGLFLSPYVRYGKVVESYYGIHPFAGTQIPGRSLHYGLAAGYKLSMSVFALEFLAGVGFGNLKFQGDDVPSPYSFREDVPLIPRLEVSLGFVFPKFKKEKKKKNNWGPAGPETDSTLGKLTKLVIYRPFKSEGKVTEYDLYVNDSATVRVSNGLNFEMIRPSGYYTFSARIEGQKTFSYFLDPGKIYYLRCGEVSNSSSDKALIELVSPEEAKYELQSR